MGNKQKMIYIQERTAVKNAGCPFANIIDWRIRDVRLLLYQQIPL